MQDQGSAGFGFVSVGISESLVALVVLLVILFGLWKLGKLVWAAFSG